MPLNKPNLFFKISSNNIYVVTWGESKPFPTRILILQLPKPFLIDAVPN